MPIKLLLHPEIETPLGKGGSLPAFICDACNKPIEDARHAFYLMRRDAMSQPYSDIAYAHSGSCFAKLHSPEGFAYADALTDFAIGLLNGAHLKHILSDEYRF